MGHGWTLRKSGDDGKRVFATIAILALFFVAATAIAQTSSSSDKARWTAPEPTIQEQLDAVEALRAPKTRASAPLPKPSPAKIATNALSKPPLIALILPSKVPAYSSAAQAVKEGFMAAAEAAKVKESCLVIEHGGGEVVSAFQQATAAEVPVIVGPLVRDDLEALQATPPLAWTITLTQFEDEGTKLPPNLFPLTLTVESDARFLAHEIFIKGREGKPVVLSNETPLMKRFADAFIDEWLHLGESAPQRVRFSADDVSTLKTRLEALSPSVVLLAVEGNDAALARAQTKNWPTYASGHIYQRQEQFEATALDRLQVVEIPWLVSPQAARFKALSAIPAAPATARLYALGYDAFQTAEAFLDGPPEAMALAGATGDIRFNRKEGLIRTGQLAVFEKGHLQPAETASP